MTDITPAAAQVGATAKAETAGQPAEAKGLELTHTFTDFDDVERTVSYRFRRPTRPQVTRAQSSMRKDVMAALRTLCLDCVVSEQREALRSDLEDYVGLAGTFGNEILGRCGFGELGK